jgi:hypothetical protein
MFVYPALEAVEAKFMIRVTILFLDIHKRLTHALFHRKVDFFSGNCFHVMTLTLSMLGPLVDLVILDWVN